MSQTLWKVFFCQIMWPWCWMHCKAVCCTGDRAEGMRQHLPWLPWDRTHRHRTNCEEVCCSSLTFLLVQDSNSKISSGILGLGVLNACGSGWDHIYTLLSCLESLDALVLIEFFGYLFCFIFPWSYFLFLFQTGANCLVCGNKQQPQTSSVFHSHTFHFSACVFL